MAIRTINATIQMRHGKENDFDPDQMTTGEWAVSDDTKKVWMCFKPGFVLRMATYETFEEDLKEIQLILSTCQSIQEAVERFFELSQKHSQAAEIYSTESKSWAVGGTGSRNGEDTDNSKYYSKKSKESSEISQLYLTKVEEAGNEAIKKLNDALDVDAPNFMMDLSTGHLMYSGGRFVFNIQSGHLMWGLAV